MGDIFAWIITIVGLIGFELAGRKVWWAWYVNLANQALWLVFALITGYWGFIAGTIFYTYQFSRNAYRWTKEHFAEPEPPKRKSLEVTDISPISSKERDNDGKYRRGYNRKN